MVSSLVAPSTCARALEDVHSCLRRIRCPPLQKREHAGSVILNLRRLSDHGSVHYLYQRSRAHVIDESVDWDRAGHEGMGENPFYVVDDGLLLIADGQPFDLFAGMGVGASSPRLERACDPIWVPLTYRVIPTE